MYMRAFFTRTSAISGAALAAILLLFFLTACTLSSCTTPGDQASAEPEPDPETAQVDEAQNRFAELIQSAEEAYEGRVSRDELDLAIGLWEEARETARSEEISGEALAEVNIALARAHYFLVRYHLSTSQDPESDVDPLTAAASGLEYAAEAVAIKAPDFHRSIARGAPYDTDLDEAPVEAVEALLWYARLLDFWSTHESVSASVANQPIVDAVMEFIVANQPDAHFGAAHRYFGIRWATRDFHRSLDRSDESFAAALEIEPGFLITAVLQALYVSKARGDRESFEAQLQAVIDAPEQILPEAEPENIFARQLAADLLERADEFFD